MKYNVKIPAASKSPLLSAQIVNDVSVITEAISPSVSKTLANYIRKVGPEEAMKNIEKLFNNPLVKAKL